jgi:hypothetical protein
MSHKTKTQLEKENKDLRTFKFEALALLRKAKQDLKTLRIQNSLYLQELKNGWDFFDDEIYLRDLKDGWEFEDAE